MRLLYCLVFIIPSIDSLCDKAKQLDAAYTKARFPQELIDMVCANSRDWFSKAVSRRGNVRIPGIQMEFAGPPGLNDRSEKALTKPQNSWLSSIQACQDLDCILNSKQDSKVEQKQKPRPGFQGHSVPFPAEPIPPGLRAEAPAPKEREKVTVEQRQSQQGRRAVRKEYRAMSDSERQRFHDALWRLKNTEIDGLSKYDILVVNHNPGTAAGAHFGPAFLPFHRELMKQIELALRLEDPSVSLPYWDSTLDSPLPAPKDSVVWNNELFGSPTGVVDSGPFAGWRMYNTQEAREFDPGLRVRRAVGENSAGSLFRQADIDQVMASAQYRDLTFCVQPFFELVHGAAHMFVGGTLVPLDLSPNDVVFFMLHSFVDKIWEDWRQARQTRSQRENQYVDSADTCSSYHEAPQPMTPFQITNKDGLSNSYTDVFYEYEPTPSCPACGGSPYLTCDTRTQRCVSKVRLGGRCDGFESLDICYKSRCVSGRCVVAAPIPPSGTTTTRPSQTRPTTQRTTARPAARPARARPARPSRPTPMTRRTTTAAPITRIPPFVNRDCLNGNRCCKIWSSAGECQRNRLWMDFGCPASCGRCQRNEWDCVDRSLNCFAWQPSCSSNAAWMEENCPVTCGVCNRATDDLLTLCGGVRSNGRCENHVGDRDCRQWSSAGECQSNKWWMESNCAKACGACVGPGEIVETRLSDCRNAYGDSDCYRWQREGECQINQEWMETNCALACSAC